MVKRITSFIGWVGVALVLVAFAVVAGQWAGVEAVSAADMERWSGAATWDAAADSFLRPGKRGGAG